MSEPKVVRVAEVVHKESWGHVWWYTDPLKLPPGTNLYLHPQPDALGAPDERYPIVMGDDSFSIPEGVDIGHFDMMVFIPSQAEVWIYRKKNDDAR